MSSLDEKDEEGSKGHKDEERIDHPYPPFIHYLIFLRTYRRMNAMIHSISLKCPFFDEVDACHAYGYDATMNYA